jgi:hypothetical protein
VGNLGTGVKRKFQCIVNRKSVDEMVEEAKINMWENENTRLIGK